MSFGSSVQAMITTLKNNEKMHSKRKKFKKSFGSSSTKSKPKFDFPEATPLMLKELAEKLRRERQKRMLKVVGLTAFVAIVLIVMVFFLMQ